MSAAGVGSSAGRNVTPSVPKPDTTIQASMVQSNSNSASGRTSQTNRNGSSTSGWWSKKDDEVSLSRESSEQQSAPTQEQQRLTHLRALEENYSIFDSTDDSDPDGITGLGDIEKIAKGELDEEQAKEKLRQQGLADDQIDERMDSIRDTATFLMEDEEFRESIDTANDKDGEGDPDGKIGRGDLDKAMLNAEKAERERKQEDAGKPPSQDDLQAAQETVDRWREPGALQRDLKDRPLSEFSGPELDALVAMNETDPEAQAEIEQAVLRSVHDSESLESLPKSEAYSYLLDKYVTGSELPEEQAKNENDPTVKAREHLNGMVKNAVDGSLDHHLEGRKGDEDLASAQDRVSSDLERMVMDNPALAKMFESQTESSFEDYSEKFTDIARADDNIFQRVNHAVTGGVRDAVGGLTEKYRDVVHDFTEATSGIAKRASGLVNSGLDLAGKVGEAGFDLVGAEGVGDNFRNAADKVGDGAESAGSFVADQYKNFSRGIHESIAGAADGIAFAVTDPVGTAKGLVEVVKDPKLLLEGYKETLNEHGVAGLAGLIVGDLGTAVLTGGGGAAAKGTSIAGKIGRLTSGGKRPTVNTRFDIGDHPPGTSPSVKPHPDTPERVNGGTDLPDTEGGSGSADLPDAERTNGSTDAPDAEGATDKPTPNNAEVGLLTSDLLDFDKGSDVVSGAQKFVLPVPKFNGGGEPLVYPKGAVDGKGNTLAGKPITDWEGNPVGDNGVVFYNHKDNSWQAVPADGNGVVIMNQVSESQGKAIQDLIGDNPNDLSLAQFKELLERAGRSPDEGGLGLGDMYNSDRGFIQSKMNKLETSDTGIDDYGLHRRDDRDVSQAVYVDGAGEFQGPAATPQKFDNGAVIIRQADANADGGYSYRLVQPDTFRETYRNKDGSPIETSEMRNQAPGADLDATPDGLNLDEVEPLGSLSDNAPLVRGEVIQQSKHRNQLLQAQGLDDLQNLADKWSSNAVPDNQRAAMINRLREENGYAQAADFYERSVVKNPGFGDLEAPFLNYVDSLKKSGRHADALQQTEDFLSRPGPHSDATTAKLLTEAGDSYEGIALQAKAGPVDADIVRAVEQASGRKIGDNLEELASVANQLAGKRFADAFQTDFNPRAGAGYARHLREEGKPEVAQQISEIAALSSSRRAADNPLGTGDKLDNHLRENTFHFRDTDSKLLPGNVRFGGAVPNMKVSQIDVDLAREVLTGLGIKNAKNFDTWQNSVDAFLQEQYGLKDGDFRPYEHLNSEQHKKLDAIRTQLLRQTESKVSGASDTNLMAELILGKGDCRHVAFSKQLLHDVWKNDLQDSFMTDALTAANKGDLTASAQALKQARDLDRQQLVTAAMEIDAPIALKNNEKYALMRDEGGQFLPGEMRNVEAHTFNMLLNYDEAGNLLPNGVVAKDSFYQHLYPLGDAPLVQNGNGSWRTKPGVMGERNCLGENIPFELRFSRYSGNKPVTNIEEVGRAQLGGLPFEITEDGSLIPRLG